MYFDWESVDTEGIICKSLLIRFGWRVMRFVFKLYTPPEPQHTPPNEIRNKSNTRRAGARSINRSSNDSYIPNIYLLAKIAGGSPGL
jgi:hypothetical protein